MVLALLCSWCAERRNPPRGGGSQEGQGSALVADRRGDPLAAARPKKRPHARGLFDLTLFPQ